MPSSQMRRMTASSERKVCAGSGLLTTRASRLIRGEKRIRASGEDKVSFGLLCWTRDPGVALRRFRPAGVRPRSAGRPPAGPNRQSA